MVADTYTILEKVGEGSGGIVYKAYHKRLQKEVVIKKLRKKSADMQMNRQEADILKNLNHMYLPQVLDFLTEGNDLYTVMSYIPGRSVKELLEEGMYQYFDTIVYAVLDRSKNRECIKAFETLV